MPEPIYSATTERLYRRLPEALREADRLTIPEYTMKRWVSGLLDQLGSVETVIDRIDYIPLDEGGLSGDTSDLTDPTTADDAWLDWLAQLVGVKLVFGLSVAQRRAAISNAVSGFRAGTKAAIAAAAQSALTGSKTVSVYDHTTDAGSLGAGGQWDVAVVTRASETASGAAVLQAIIDAGAKPAGVKLWHRNYEATWTQIETQTWDQIDAKTWTQLEESGL